MYRAAVILCFATALIGCGDNIPANLPGSISAGPVAIRSAPLELRVTGGSGEFQMLRFIEIASVATPDPFHYYDPADPEVALTWQTIEAAASHDAATNSFVLRLDDGDEIRLGLEDGPTQASAILTLDTTSAPNVVLARLVLPRADEEALFGFGETFDSPISNRTTREMQLRVDPSSESGLNEVHVPIPLALWPARGVGVFIDDPRPAAFDVGERRADAVLATFTQSVPGALATHFFVSEDPLELVRRYAALTALPAVPPEWAFAPQQWRNEHSSSDEVRDDATQMRTLGIPGSTMWIDNPWQTAYNSFEFDTTRFANFEALLDELKALGYRVVVWSTPYVNRDGPTADEFAEARALDYLVKDNTGRPFVFPWQDGPGSLVDFSRRGATDWWQQRIKRATDLGIAGFKLDFGEDLVPELAGSLTPFELADGNAQTQHAAYSELYHRAYFDALPRGDAFLITRAGSPGDQAVNPSIWPGDLSSDFSRHGVDNGQGEINVGGLPAAISGGLSLSVSGYPFYGSDIGGFRDGPTSTEVLIRWAQYASLGTIMQLGGGGPSHNPWDTALFGPEALPIYRSYARLHMDLFPTLYTLAQAAGRDGTPVTVPTRFLYPQSKSDDMTFLVGDVLFVAPVVEDGARTRRVVLPPGEWVDYWTGTLFIGDGSTEIEVSAPLDTLPLWQRRGAVLALFTIDADTLEPATAVGVRSYADPAFGSELTFRLAPGAELTSGSVFDGSGFRGEATASSYRISVAAGSRFQNFTVELHVVDGAPNPIANPMSVTAAQSPLLQVLLRSELLACDPDPGCWMREPTSVLHIRSSRTSLDVAN